MRELIVGAVFIGTSPIWVKALALTPNVSAFYRTSLGALFLFLLYNRKLFPFNKKIFLRALLAGLFFALDLSCWHKSIVYIGAGRATILANTQVFYLTLWSILMTSNKPKAQFYIFILLAFLGITLLLGSGEISSNQSLGIYYGLLTGPLYALLTLSIRWLRDITSSEKALFLTSVFASIFLYFISSPIPMPQSSDWISLLGLGILVHCGGWYFIGQGLPKTTPALSGLLLLIQPVLATILSVLIFQENFNFIQVCGLALTLISLYFGPRFASK